VFALPLSVLLIAKNDFLFAYAALSPVLAGKTIQQRLVMMDEVTRAKARLFGEYFGNQPSEGICHIVRWSLRELRRVEWLC
jgi:hypothetical protein